MPSSSPEPLWKPWLLSVVAYTSDTVAWQIEQLKTSSSIGTSLSAGFEDNEVTGAMTTSARRDVSESEVKLRLERALHPAIWEGRNDRDSFLTKNKT